jgi:photosystem II stability/assembly factor-like uncharacterized protein
MAVTICVGTVGSGIFASQDGGATWKQGVMKMPYPPWAPWIQIRALAASPHQPGVFLAGSDLGLHRSRDSGATWEFMTSPADKHQVWSIAFHPTDSDTILVGVAPFETDVNIVRTRDGGETWDVLDVPAPQRSIVGATHITSIHFDPRDSDRIWASCELGGLYRSDDGGDSWARVKETLGDRKFSGDVHSVSVTPKGRIFATSPEGLWISEDEANSFRLHQFPAFPEPEPAGLPDGIIAYSRGIAQKVDDPNVLFVGTGDYTPGKTGAIQRSVDGGQTWAAAPLSAAPNSHFYWFATNRADPDYMAAVTMFGYLYVSEDAGGNWKKLPREFGEIRGVAWAPN